MKGHAFGSYKECLKHLYDVVKANMALRSTGTRLQGITHRSMRSGAPDCCVYSKDY